MHSLGFNEVVILAAVLGLALLGWVVPDAQRRGKPPVLVFLLIVAFFPLGLLVWLLFRPPLEQR